MNLMFVFVEVVFFFRIDTRGWAETRVALSSDKLGDPKRLLLWPTDDEEHLGELITAMTGNGFTGHSRIFLGTAETVFPIPIAFP